MLMPPDPVKGISMNGWTFTAKPTIPYQRKWKVTLHGMKWFLQSNGLFDTTTQPMINARRLELFYQSNGVWDNFSWTHPHLGALTCRFDAAVAVPAGIPNSGGLIEAFEITLVEHNPGYS
jgi:hypothetical protein